MEPPHRLACELDFGKTLRNLEWICQHFVETNENKRSNNNADYCSKLFKIIRSLEADSLVEIASKSFHTVISMC